MLYNDSHALLLGSFGEQMRYWPGTNIVKSHGNAFDWRNYKDKSLIDDWDWKASVVAKQNSAGNGNDKRRTFTIYSKAHPSK